MESAGNAIASTECLLERFIAADYSLHSPYVRNFFCIRCMEGPLHASEFQDGEAHASHPNLQVLKHTFRTHVVSLGDTSNFIDTSRLQPFITNGCAAYALRSRRLRESPAERRLCGRCQDTITSTNPDVTFCSIECLLHSNRARQRIAQQAAASTRVGRTSKKRKTMDDEDDEEMALQGAQSTEARSEEAASGRREEARVPRAADGVRWARAERRWSTGNVGGTSESNPNFNRHHLTRVRRHVSTFATSI